MPPRVFSLLLSAVRQYSKGADLVLPEPVLTSLLFTASFLALISTAFNAAVSGLMGAGLGVHTVSSTMQSNIASQDKTIRYWQINLYAPVAAN
jgi:hypothetical protein